MASGNCSLLYATTPSLYSWTRTPDFCTAHLRSVLETGQMYVSCLVLILALLFHILSCIKIVSRDAAIVQKSQSNRFHLLFIRRRPLLACICFVALPTLVTPFTQTLTVPAVAARQTLPIRQLLTRTVSANTCSGFVDILLVKVDTWSDKRIQSRHT
jgi:hypothetical protein